jgi:hypothetical protein
VKPDTHAATCWPPLVLTALPQQLADAIEALVTRAGGSVVAEVERLSANYRGTSAREQLGLALRSRPTSPTGAGDIRSGGRGLPAGRAPATRLATTVAAGRRGRAQAWPRGRRAKRGRRSRS